jgi:hypothetical protein
MAEEEEEEGIFDNDIEIKGEFKTNTAKTK